MSIDVTAVRAEFRTSLMQALEIEQQREAEVHERIRRAYEDATAFTRIAAETRTRINELVEDIARLAPTSTPEHT